MLKIENNYAFIDSQNLKLSIRDAGWNLDFKKFRKFLEEKYGVSKAFLFLGYVKENEYLYRFLKKAGFICIFKPTILYRNARTKGNCDAELVLHTMIQYQNYNKALIVSGDGDFYCLIKYLLEQNKLKKVLIPNQEKYSALLKGFPSGYLAFLNDLRHRLSKRKEPLKDGTLRRAFRSDYCSILSFFNKFARICVVGALTTHF